MPVHTCTTAVVAQAVLTALSATCTPALQIVGDRYGVGIDDTHVRLRGAPVLDEPALDVYQQASGTPGCVPAGGLGRLPGSLHGMG